MARMSTVLDADDPKPPEARREGGREGEADGRAPAHAIGLERSWAPPRGRQVVPAWQPGSHDRPEPGVIHRLESILRPSAAADAGALAQERPRLIAVARRRALGR